MDAPIDIVISIIARHKREALQEREEYTKYSTEWHYQEGKAAACDDLIEELEGFKKLFS